MDRSNSLAEQADISRRLNAVIPGGAHTYSRGDDQFPQYAPAALSHGKGAYVWDSQGRKYLDYGMALRSVVLGYADERVNAAAVVEIAKGVGLTRASLTELAAAEFFCSYICSAEMVKFAKNGSNVTTAAVKIARAYTARRYVCVPRQHPFFSFDDWFIGTTAVKRGVAAGAAASTLVFDYNDLSSLSALFDAHPGEIAAVMMEPATHITPCGGCAGEATWPAPPCGQCSRTEGNFLRQAKALAHRHGALFILDEMITGFRWHAKGAQHFFGIEPDLSTFGKAMANGFALAALCGKREFMKVGAINDAGMERTFLLSSTHGGEMPALGAFIAAARIIEDENVPLHLWRYGEALRGKAHELARKHGLAGLITLEGPAVALVYVTRDRSGQPSTALRTLFHQEMLAHGVMMPWISQSQAHGETELLLTLEAMDVSMAIYAKALDGKVETFLKGPAVKPVFRSHN